MGDIYLDGSPTIFVADPDSTLDYNLYSESLDEDLESDLLTVSGSDPSTGSLGKSEYYTIPDDYLTNEEFSQGISDVVTAVDPYSVQEDTPYIDSGFPYAASGSLPEYAVTYMVNGVEVVFPSSYADDIMLQDGLLINLGANYTLGAVIDGASVNNYLSSEISVPTYHSSTWYQYLQSYGQPYRVVDRYINNYGSVSSQTRDTVSLEWSGGSVWQGFDTGRVLLYIGVVTLVLLLFRGFKK